MAIGQCDTVELCRGYSRIVVARIDNARSSDFLPFHQVSLINVLCAFIDPTFALRMCSFVLHNFCSLTSFKTVRPSRPLASNYTN